MSSRVHIYSYIETWFISSWTNCFTFPLHEFIDGNLDTKLVLAARTDRALFPTLYIVLILDHCSLRDWLR